MKIRPQYCFALAFCFCGCNTESSTNSNPVVENVETISEYDYEYYTGYNAALRQFGGDSAKFVDLSNKQVVKYTSDNDSQGYADGYHKALDILDTEYNPKCPHVH